MAERAATAIASDVDDEADAAARCLVESGRFVPGLAVGDDGRARSWWWPMPSAGDRDCDCFPLRRRISRRAAHCRDPSRDARSTRWCGAGLSTRARDCSGLVQDVARCPRRGCIR